MGRISARVAAWGRRNLGKGDLKNVLAELHQKRGMSQKQIAEKFKVSATSIRYWLKKHGLLRAEERRVFPEALKAIGYRSVDDFFTDPRNVFRTIKQLAVDTGFCAVTVSQWYNKFLSEKRKGSR